MARGKSDTINKIVLRVHEAIKQSHGDEEDVITEFKQRLESLSFPPLYDAKNKRTDEDKFTAMAEVIVSLMARPGVTASLNGLGLNACISRLVPSQSFT